MRILSLLCISLVSNLVFSQQSNPLFQNQWALKNSGQSYLIKEEKLTFKTKAPEHPVDLHWQLGPKVNSSHSKIVVAVIDQGIDYNHPDLIGKIWLNPEICPNQTQDEKTNPLCFGRNMIDPEQTVMDTHGHGTHVAGIIAASNNQIGIIGAAYDNIVIMPLKVNDPNINFYIYKGHLLSDYYAMAIRFAIKHGAHVINMSGGFPKHHTTKQFEAAIKEAEAANIPVIASAGNNNKNLPVYPCRYQSVICVGSVGNDGLISKHSNYSQKVDVLAPGEHIISTYPLSQESRILRKSGYEIKDGTSQAAPFVSAAIANLISTYPLIKLSEIRLRLFSSAEDLAPQEKFANYGLINMTKLMESPPSVYFHPEFKENDLIILASGSKKFTYSFKVRNISQTSSPLTLTLAENPSIKFEKMTLKSPTLKTGESYTFNISGEITDYSRDHLLDLHFKLSSAEYHKAYRANLFITRKLSDVSRKTLSLKSETFESKYFNLVTPYQKQALIKPVMSANGKGISPEFYTTKSMKEKQSRYLGIFSISKSEIKEKKTSLPLTDFVQNIFKGDFNLDGNLDYLIYTLRTQKNEDGEEKLFYVMHFKDQNLKPLFGSSHQSTWSISLDYPYLQLRQKTSASSNRYQAVPLLSTFQKHPLFSWFKYKTETFGEILLPVVKMNGYSFQKGEIDIIDFRPATAGSQYFLLKPELSESEYTLSAEPLLDNLLDQKIREMSAHSIKPWHHITLGDPIPGEENTFFLSIGEEDQQDYFKLTFDHEAQMRDLKKIEAQGALLHKNEIYPVTDIKDGSLSAQYLAHYSRYQTRNIFMSPDGISATDQADSENWNDPFFFLIDSFKNGHTYQYYFASRYWLHYFSSQGEHKKLPIMRESSFDINEFSETTEAVIIKTPEDLTTGVSIDSTKLYGDLSYIALAGPNEFHRPVEFTYHFDYSCNYFPVIKFTGDAYSHQVFVCTQGEDVSLELVPLRY